MSRVQTHEQCCVDEGLVPISRIMSADATWWRACGAVTFRESVEIGETALSPQEVQQVVHEMGSAYKGNRYHLLQKNCNAFSNDLCIRLTGKPAPAWVRMH